MKPENFDFLTQLLKRHSGLVLTQDKLYLLKSRLLPVARRHELSDMDELVDSLRTNNKPTLQREVIEEMTINESFFFRDRHPFDQFRQFVLPQLLKTRSGKRQIRIWSAAASTGQEPYSIAMILKEEAYKLSGWRVEIVATDLSREVLNRATQGIYNPFEVQRGLPAEMLKKYFTQVEGNWQIDKEIRSMVQFRQFNLLDSMLSLGSFDVVFCRNVLIYFDQSTKTSVLTNIARLMPDDGFLYLGSTETILGISDVFQTVPEQRGIYHPATSKP